VKRFQTLLFVLAAVGLALVGMLVAGIVIGTDPHTEKPAPPVLTGDPYVARLAGVIQHTR